MTISKCILWLLAAGMGLAAIDTYLPSLGVDAKAVELAAQAQLRGSGAFYPGSVLSREALGRLKAMPGPQKAGAVTEALQLAKSVVSSAAFAKAHEEYLTTQLRAANHGLDLKTEEAALQKRMTGGSSGDPEAMMKVAGAQMAQSFRKMDKNTLKMMLDMELKEGDAKLKKIAPLIESNFEEFRKQYSLLKSASMGGPATEAEFQAALGEGASQQDRRKLLDEQKAWNQYNLKSSLTRRLDEFIATASTVDFAAQTAPSGGKIRFVNPAYERKSNEWKMMFRAGREPVQAALEFARQWRAELR